MSDEPLLSPPVLPPPGRIEYLDFQNVAEHREFRFRIHGPDGWAEIRLRIAIAAFVAARVGLQDGPDVCYQKLLPVAASQTATAGPDVIVIDEVDLASYRESHTRAPKHRSWTPAVAPAPALLPPKEPKKPAPRLPVAPLVANGRPSALEEGQRVSHAVYGVGVTTSSNDNKTVVRFDQDGPKTFVTSMLKVEVLSAPHTWETSARGKNRPCRTVSAADASDPGPAAG